MKTEDDTFKKLRQMPFAELDKEYFESGIKNAKDRAAWFEARGWTWREYVDELTEILTFEKHSK